LTAFLERILGRLPIGWLQLSHSRTRLAAALAGVAFANILVLMQLGFLGAMIRSIALPYKQFNADILISGSDMNTLTDGSPLPRQRMFEALSVDGVARATPVYFGKVDWKQPDGTIRNLDVFGIDPEARAFRTPAINIRRDELTLSDIAIIDSGTRNVAKQVFADIDAGKYLSMELKGRTVTIVGTFSIGGGFAADGSLIVSDQTFRKLFPQRSPGAPNHIFVTLEPGASAGLVVDRLRSVLPSYDTIVRTVDEAVAKDQSFQTTQRPIGIVFGFGVAIGIMVGLIIVYQVLSTDVADHLKEYATFKAIGYPQRFFLAIILEEAVLLAVIGFIPGLLFSIGLYRLVSLATALPLIMNVPRALAVLVGTIIVCVLSGAIATRKLTRANPADLF
jgi:putative ABC transport system permease protein